MVVALGLGLNGGYALNYETLNGVTTQSVQAPSNLSTDFVPAANGSVVFLAEGTTENSMGGVWLMHSDGSVIELDSSSEDFQPSISYDGSKVVFGRYDPTSGRSGIYVINADGTGLRLVVSSGPLNFVKLPTFSPDGGSIAYWCGPLDGTDNQSKTCGPLTDGSYRNSGVMRINADGSNPRMIVIAGGDPILPDGPNGMSWSPDGQWIALDGALTVYLPGGAETAWGQLFAYHTDGSDLFNNADPSRQVTHETDDDPGPINPQFCGNSTQILFEDAGTGAGTFVINRDGTGRHQVTLYPTGPYTPIGQPVCVLPASGDAPPPLVDATHITVPSLHALGAKAAKRKLRADNLSVGKVTYRYSPSVRKNRVLSQRPKAGAVAHRIQKIGPRVNLVLSRGRHR